MNDAFLRILGFARGEVIGRTSIELDLCSSPDHRASLTAELRAKGRVEAREERMRRRDGSIATVLFSAVPAVVSGELHTITWVLDIGARQETEEALRAGSLTSPGRAMRIAPLSPGDAPRSADRACRPGTPACDLCGSLTRRMQRRP